MTFARDLLTRYSESFQNRRETEMSVSEYLELCRTDPMAYASAPERILAAIGEPVVIDTSKDARLGRIFATNVTGAFLCAREAVARMSTTRGGVGGAIVNVSSRAAQLGAPGEYVDYAASKAAIETLTIGLAREVAGEGIRVNGVRPGIIYSDIHASGGEPGRVDRLGPQLPMKRGGEAVEVARAILWLLSDEASYSTGTFIDVAGGR